MDQTTRQTLMRIGDECRVLRGYAYAVGRMAANSRGLSVDRRQLSTLANQMQDLREQLDRYLREIAPPRRG